MIRVTVQLLSAIHSSRSTELARMDIYNDGEQSLDNPRRGTYVATTFRGRSSEALDRGIPQKRAEVANWPRQDLHVWNLVRWCLQAMGYTQDRPNVRLAGLHYAEPRLAGWGVKDYADGWTVYPDEATANYAAQRTNGAVVEPLYSFAMVGAAQLKPQDD